MEKKWICKDSECTEPCFLTYETNDDVYNIPQFCPWNKENVSWKKLIPTFTMLIGIPGSGKSTWIKENSKGYEIVCPDVIRTEICGDISDQSKNNE